MPARRSNASRSARVASRTAGVVDRVVDGDEAVAAQRAGRRLGVLLERDERALGGARALDERHVAVDAAGSAVLGVVLPLVEQRLQHQIRAALDLAVAVAIVLHRVAVAAELRRVLEQRRRTALIDWGRSRLRRRANNGRRERSSSQSFQRVRPNGSFAELIRREPWRRRPWAKALTVGGGVASVANQTVTLARSRERYRQPFRNRSSLTAKKWSRIWTYDLPIACAQSRQRSSSVPMLTVEATAL